MYRHVVRPLLFALEAERAHELVMQTFGAHPWMYPNHVAKHTIEFPGCPTLCFRGPIGLAAGADKDGRAIGLWPRMGFGFMELGGVTAQPQEGNPKPRLFRFARENTVINRMGLNNRGVDALAEKLRHLVSAGIKTQGVPIGVNVGKSKSVPNEEAERDYLYSIRSLGSLPDYITINVSSPNTPGLRDLLDPQRLGMLLGVLRRATPVPLFLKVTPDLSSIDLRQVLKVAAEEGMNGIVATNTSTSIKRPSDWPQDGGLSGMPLYLRSREVISCCLALGSLPVIGVGGIFHADQVRELLKMGCIAVQLYSALVFEGPGLIHRMNRELGILSR